MTRSTGTVRWPSRAWIQRGAWVAGVLVLLYLLGLRVALLLPPVQSMARARVEQELGARFGEARLTGSIRGGVGTRLRLGPLTMGEGGLITVEEVTVSWSLGAGHLVPRGVVLKGVRLRLDRETPANLARMPLFQRKEKKRGERSSSESVAKLSFEDLSLEQTLTQELARELGPFRGELSRDRARLKLPDGGDLLVKLIRSEGRVEVQGELEDLTLLSGRWLGRRAATLDASASLSGQLRAELDTETREGTAQFTVHLASASIQEPRIAKAPLKDFEGGVTGKVDFSVPERTFTLHDSQLWLGPKHELRVEVGAVVSLRDEPAARAKVRLLPVTDAQLLAALPEELRPPSEAPHFRGHVAANARFEGDLRDPDTWVLEAKLDLEDARRQSRAQPTLASEFKYTAVTANERSFSVTIGPSNPNFVPFIELPDHVSRAVLTSEDAGFFGHSGFDLRELRNSVVDALMKRRVRGASTLSQQLSKNLFLSREHTLARKVREALTTLALEASVPKQRLLEIYLNAVEWGPGIYGIGTASRHYFNKDARDLSPKEAAFLATLLPSPVRYHVYHLRGLSPVWEQRLSDLLYKMAEESVITWDELKAANEESLHFAATCGT